MRHSILFCLAILALAACGTTRAQIVQSKLATQVTLAPGATAEWQQAGIQIQFVAITQDSRCPRDVTCVWAGEVNVQLSVRVGAQPPTRHEILAGQSVLVDEYRVTVIRVQPEPIATEKIVAQNYRVTLQVTSAK